MAKIIQLEFKINGINQSIASVDTLEQKLGSLTKTFQGTITVADDSISKLNSSLGDTGSAAEQASGKLDNFGKGLSAGAGEAGKGLDDTKTKIGELGNELDSNADKSRVFGSELTNTARGSSVALRGLADVFKLFGVDVTVIQEISRAFKGLFELIHGQSKLTEVITGTQNLKEQSKAVSELGAESKVLSTETKAVAAAQGINAEATVVATSATEGATIATRLLATAMEALPILAIIAGIAALVGAYEYFAGASQRANEAETERLKTTNAAIELDAERLQIQKELNAINQSTSLVSDEEKLKLLQSQHNTIQEQFKVEKDLLDKKKEGLKTQIDLVFAEGGSLNNAADKAQQTAKELQNQKDILKTLEEHQSVYQKIRTSLGFQNSAINDQKTKIDEATAKDVAAQGEKSKALAEGLGIQASLNALNKDAEQTLINQTREKLIQNKIDRDALLASIQKKKEEAQQGTANIDINTINLQNKLEEQKLLFEKEEAKTIEEIQQREKNRSDAFVLQHKDEITAINQKADAESTAATNAFNDAKKEAENRLKTTDKNDPAKTKADQDLIVSLTKDFGNKITALNNQTNAQLKIADETFEENKIKNRQDSINKQSDIANKEFDNTLTNVQANEGRYTELVQKGGLFRIAAIKKEQQNILNEINAGVDKDIAAQERLRNEALLSAKNDDEIKAVNDKYNQIEDIIRDKGDKARESAKKFFQGTTKEIITQAEQIIGALQGVFDSLTANQIAAIQSQEDTINKQEQNAIDSFDRQKQALENALSEQENIVADSQSKINSLEEQLKGSREQRHKFLLTLIDAEQKRLQQAAKQKDAIASQEVSAQAKRDADAQAAKDKIDALEKERKKKELDQQEVSAIVNVAVGVTKAFESGPILGIILGALISAAGAVQIANIESQKSKLGDGGLISGKSHDQGGVKGTGNIETEGGEFVVNKKSTLLNRDIIEEINRNKDKKFKLISNDTIARLKDGGIVNQPNFNAISDAIAFNNSSALNSNIKDIVVEAIKAQPAPEVSVVEINRVQDTVKVIQNSAKI